MYSVIEKVDAYTPNETRSERVRLKRVTILEFLSHGILTNRLSSIAWGVSRENLEMFRSTTLHSSPEKDLCFRAPAFKCRLDSRITNPAVSNHSIWPLDFGALQSDQLVDLIFDIDFEVNSVLQTLKSIL